MRHRATMGAAVALAVVAAILGGCDRSGTWHEPRHEAGRAQAELPKVTVTVGQTPLDVEVADQPEERRMGYMYRDKPDAGGMLFVYPDEQRMAYHMKDVTFDIDIAFITEDGRIDQIEHMKAFMVSPPRRAQPGRTPNEARTWDSLRPVKYALEVPAGWFAANNIRAGDKVTIPAEVTASE